MLRRLTSCCLLSFHRAWAYGRPWGKWYTRNSSRLSRASSGFQQDVLHGALSHSAHYSYRIKIHHCGIILPFFYQFSIILLYCTHNNVDAHKSIFLQCAVVVSWAYHVHGSPSLAVPVVVKWCICQATRKSSNYKSQFLCHHDLLDFGITMHTCVYSLPQFRNYRSLKTWPLFDLKSGCWISVWLQFCLIELQSCRADVNVQKMLSLDYASQREHNKLATANMIQRLQEREGDTGSTLVQSESNTAPSVKYNYTCAQNCMQLECYLHVKYWA